MQPSHDSIILIVLLSTGPAVFRGTRIFTPRRGMWGIWNSAAEFRGISQIASRSLAKFGSGPAGGYQDLSSKSRTTP